VDLTAFAQHLARSFIPNAVIIDATAGTHTQKYAAGFANFAASLNVRHKDIRPAVRPVLLLPVGMLLAHQLFVCAYLFL